jgi:hypothetical protein
MKPLICPPAFLARDSEAESASEKAGLFTRPRPIPDHQAELRECLLLGDEPPFLLGTSPPLDMLLLHFHIYFSDRTSGGEGGLKADQEADELTEYWCGHPAEWTALSKAGRQVLRNAMFGAPEARGD